MVRYKEFLDIFQKKFYKLNPSLNRNDRTMYSIFAYIALFRLDELQIKDFQDLVKSVEARKMHVFLQFTFNADLLR